MSIQLSRRTFLTGLIAAPIVITTPGLLMPVKALTPAPGLLLKYEPGDNYPGYEAWADSSGKLHFRVIDADGTLRHHTVHDFDGEKFPTIVIPKCTFLDSKTALPDSRNGSLSAMLFTNVA